MKDKTFTFAGFDAAGTTCVPDIVFDELLAILSGAELKALLYIIRRTLGFKKDGDAISLNQFHKGISTKDGKQLDKGCGVSDRTTLLQALNKLEEYKIINRIKSTSSQGDSDTTVYSIRYKEVKGVVGKPDHPNRKGSRETRLGVVGKPDDGGGETRLGVVGKPDPQDTVIQDTVKQLNSNTTNNAANASVNQPGRGKNTVKKKLQTLETFDFKQAVTPESIMQLGDIWRGSALPVNNRADSDYTKALTAAATLSQRLRGNNTRGYSLEEINAAYKFFKRIGTPGQIAEDWWKGKNVDIWVVAKNIDKALDKLGSYSQPEETAPDLEEEDEENKLVLISKVKVLGSEARNFWYLYSWMKVSEARQYGYGSNSNKPEEKRLEPVSQTKNEIANMLSLYPEEARRLEAEYISQHAAELTAALVSA